MKTTPEDAALVLKAIWRNWLDRKVGEDLQGTEVPWLEGYTKLDKARIATALRHLCRLGQVQRTTVNHGIHQYWPSRDLIHERTRAQLVALSKIHTSAVVRTPTALDYIQQEASRALCDVEGLEF